MLKAVRAIFGATLVMAAVSACSDDPLSEGREDGAYFELNPTVAVVNAGGDATVSAVVVNRYGGAIDAPVTATPCNARITAEVDTTRVEAFEPPERFVVHGVSLGESCLVVNGGGLTDTITVRVVAGRLEIVGDSTTTSAIPTTYSYQVLNENGQEVPGIIADSIRYAVRLLDLGGTAVIDSLTGVLTPRAMGPVEVIVRARMYGALRADTVLMYVEPGTFDGTFTPPTPEEGSLMSIIAGTLPFDSDTQVEVNGVMWPWRIGTPTATTLNLATPPTGDVRIYNMGSQQYTVNATIPVVSHEPADNSIATARVMSESDTMWFSLDATDTLDYTRFDVPGADGLYVISMTWQPTGENDVDLLLFDAAGVQLTDPEYMVCATEGTSEACNMTLTNGTYYFATKLVAGDSTTARLQIVAPAAFTGTVTPGTVGVAETVTFSGGGVTFDADTYVTFEGVRQAFVLDRTATSITVVVPGGIVSPTSGYVIWNLGATQSLAAGDINIDSLGDPWDGNDSWAAYSMWPALDTTYHISIASGEDRYFGFNMPAAGTITLTVDWNEPEAFLGVYGTDSTGAYVYDQCFFLPSGSPSEVSCEIDLPAGLTVLNIWDYGAVGDYDNSRLYPEIGAAVTIEVQ